VVILLGLAFHWYQVVSPTFLLKQLFFLQAIDKNQVRLIAGLLLHPLQHMAHPPSLLSYAHDLPRGLVGLRLSILAPNATYWSLSIEEYLYLLWAPVILRCSRRVIFSIGVFICVFEMFLRWYFADAQGYFSMIFRFDALLYGALLALLLERKRGARISAVWPRAFDGVSLAALAGIAAILFALRPVVGFEIHASPLFLALGLPLISLATAAAPGSIILLANSGWWINRLLRAPFLQFIGTISYTMYVVHVLAALCISHMLALLEPWIQNGYLLIQAVLSILLTIGTARLSWHFLEKPLVRWKDRRLPATRVAEPQLNSGFLELGGSSRALMPSDDCLYDPRRQEGAWQNVPNISNVEAGNAPRWLSGPCSSPLESVEPIPGPVRRP
jgi:peptidoglycan/LPS O-acetylase OafA/YrhL